ncbi:MAG: efflux RND transporter periplasmic adaptor subunit [Beijerinckiaceae bacterium]|nr:efflux RND transporter periplasmic adaptor subunit [Beijerinckiaceae bacterium]
MTLHRTLLLIAALGLGVLPGSGVLPGLAAELVLAPTRIVETKAVVGRIEARDVIPARPRIGGTLVRLAVSEGERIVEGQSIATVIDDKLALQLQAAEARIRALGSEQGNVQAEYERARTLLERGAGTQQRVDALRTQLEVLRNQISAAEAEKAVIVQQGVEGEVLAPIAGRVLKVPVTRGAVVMPGEQIALIAGGGFFLRLALPERHAPHLRVGSAVPITLEGGARVEGKLVKVFPQIENGRVIADVELASIGDFFVGARVLADVPVGERMALLVPKAAVSRRSGLDFVTVQGAAGPRPMVVVPGPEHAGDRIEILTGLQAGDRVVTP